MLNVLLLGGGGREVAIAKALTKDSITLYYANEKENYQISQITQEYISDTSLYNVMKICKEKKITYVFIGPERFLGSYTEVLKSHRIKVIGPGKDAILEFSKMDTRTFINKIDKTFNPKYYINKLEYGKDDKFVIKPNGLTGGKGVKLYPDNFDSYEEAVKYTKSLSLYLIEERLVGEEFSLMAFTDGETLRFMPLVQDYKRAYENDKGPNTGSMGSISNFDGKLYFLEDNELEKCKELMRKTISKHPKYKGVLYGSFMKTFDNKLKLIEYNCRFGDPEAINVLSVLKTSLNSICINILNNNLKEVNIEWENKATLLRYVVPKKYPQEKETYDFTLNNLKNIYLASISKLTKDENKVNITTSKSRTYALLKKEIHLDLCIKEMNELQVSNKLRRRKDIGENYLKKASQYIYTKKGGINTNQINQCLNDSKNLITGTYNDNVTSKFGEFGGNFQFNNTELISSTDGVGTKILLLEKVFGNKGYEIAGQDLVNHNINDILVNGGSPLFFLNYYGCNQFEEEKFHYFIKGVATSCKKYNIPIMGGETAVMKDVYKEGKTDLIGTIVGEKKYNFTKEFKNGDLLLGIKASGFHTNGFSIIRQEYDDTMLEGILEPHKCYLELIDKLNKKLEIKGLCHITGGGFQDNLDRVLGNGNYILKQFNLPKYYNKLTCKYDTRDCMNMFNCGIGLVIICDSIYKTYIDTITENKVIGHVKLNSYLGCT
jgi:phosphoribosylamine--glycine ligase/phosphoribosylaminoimidazole synthetase